MSSPGFARCSALLQTIGWWSRPTAYLEALPRALRAALHDPPARPVAVRDPVGPRRDQGNLQAPPDVLHPGEGASILKPIVGPHSVILLDEGPAWSSASCCCRPSTARRSSDLAGLMADLAEREVAAWPREEPIALHPRLQRLTLEIVLRAVFGLERARSSTRCASCSPRSSSLARARSRCCAVAQPLAGRGPMGRLARLERPRPTADLRADRRAPPRRGGRVDVLALLLGGRHEDGSPMSPRRAARPADHRPGRRAMRRPPRSSLGRSSIASRAAAWARLYEEIQR